MYSTPLYEMKNGMYEHITHFSFCTERLETYSKP